MNKILNLFFILISFASIAQFQNPKAISISESYGILDFANQDVDGDGFKDVISLNDYNNSVSIYKNDSHGRFIPFSEIANIEGNQLIVADIDNDSDIDILVSSSFSQQLRLIPNIGLGEYGTPITIFSAGSISYLKTMDFDGDNDIDIILNVGINILCLENLGAMTFNSPIILGTTAGNYAVQDLVVGDINNDLIDDIIFYSYYNVFAVQSLGNGNFTSPQVLFTVQTNPLLTIGDFNNDNLNDLIVNNQSDTWTDWNDLYVNNGNGTFTNTGTFSFLPCAIKLLAGDIDNDGDEDIAGFFCDVSLKWYENDGSGSFPEHVIEAVNLPNPYSQFDGVLSDYDNDNDLDFLSSNQNLDIIRCNTFIIDSFATSFRVSNQLEGVIGFDTGDLNGDGLIDIAAGATDLGIYYNLGNSLYGARTIIAELGVNASEHFKTIKLFDIDTDGDLDIFATVVFGSGVRLYINDGTGNFQPQVLNCYVSQIDQIDFGDYNGDGDIDILVSGSSTIGIINNLGSNSFNYQNVSGGNSSMALAVAFSNQPNSYGYKMIYSAYSNHIRYHSSNSNGLFSGSGSIIYNNQNIDAAVFYDLDNDTDKDLIITSYDSIGWRQMTPSNLGTFQTLASLPGTTIFCKQISDYNNDGNEDIFFVTQNNLGVFPSQGPLQYSTPIWLLNQHASTYGELKFGDIENDGDKDIIRNHLDYIEIGANEIIAPYQVKGKVFVDYNQNGVFDPNDQPINWAHLIANPQQKQAFSDYSGNYYLNFESSNIGLSEIWSIGIGNGWSLTTVNPYMINITIPNTGLDTLDFGYFPSIPSDSIQLNLTGGFPRCNQFVNYYITTGNHGTTHPSGTIEMELHSAINYVSATVPPTSVQGNTIIWQFDSLNYFENELIQLTVQMPDFNFGGDTLTSFVNATILDGSGIPLSTVNDTLKQVLLCAYDPNDKSVFPIGDGIFGDISPETPDLEYLVRFQNTGNDTAISIVIKDVIDPNLNFLGIVPISSSHPMEITFGNNREISFIFNSILLPDSSTNEIESHGFVKFKVPLTSNLSEGTIIHNEARIYFDSNPAVVTNTTTNRIKEEDPPVLSVFNKDHFLLSASPNPTNGTLKITSGYSSMIEKLDIYSTDGQLLGQYNKIHHPFFVMDLPQKNGLYYVVVTLSDESTHQLPIIKFE